MKNNHFYYLVKLFFTSHKLLAHNRTDTLTLDIADNSSSSHGPESPGRKVAFKDASFPLSTYPPNTTSRYDNERTLTPVKLRRCHSYIGGPKELQDSELEVSQRREFSRQIESAQSIEELLDIIERIQALKLQERALFSPYYKKLRSHYDQESDKGLNQNQLNHSKSVLLLLIADYSDFQFQKNDGTFFLPGDESDTDSDTALHNLSSSTPCMILGDGNLVSQIPPIPRMSYDFPIQNKELTRPQKFRILSQIKLVESSDEAMVRLSTIILEIYRIKELEVDNLFQLLSRYYEKFPKTGVNENQIKVSKRVLELLVSSYSDIHQQLINTHMDCIPNDDPEIYILLSMLNHIKKEHDEFNKSFNNLREKLKHVLDKDSDSPEIRILLRMMADIEDGNDVFNQFLNGLRMNNLEMLKQNYDKVKSALDSINSQRQAIMGSKSKEDPKTKDDPVLQDLDRKYMKLSKQLDELDLSILRFKKTIILLINLLKFDSKSQKGASSTSEIQIEDSIPEKIKKYPYFLMNLTNNHLIKYGQPSLKVIQNLFSIAWELIQAHKEYGEGYECDQMLLRMNRKDFTTKILFANYKAITGTVIKMDYFFKDLYTLKEVQKKPTQSDLLKPIGIFKIAEKFNEYEQKLSCFLGMSKKQKDELSRQISRLDVPAILKEKATQLDEVIRGRDVLASVKEKATEFNKAIRSLDVSTSLIETAAKLDEAMSGLDVPASLKEKATELNKIMRGLDVQASLKETTTELNKVMRGLDVLSSLKETAAKLNEPMSGLDILASLKEAAAKLDEAMSGLDVLASLTETATELNKVMRGLDVLTSLKETATELNEAIRGLDVPASLKETAVKLDEAMRGLDVLVSKEKATELNEAMRGLDVLVSKEKATELNDAIKGVLDKSELAQLNDQLIACQNFNKMTHRKLSLFIWALHGVKLAFPYPHKFSKHDSYYHDLYVNQSVLVLLNAILDDFADQAQMPRAVELAISIFPNNESEEIHEFVSSEHVRAHLDKKIQHVFQEFQPVKDELIDYLVFAWTIFTESFNNFKLGLHKIYCIKKLEKIFDLSFEFAEKLSEVISEDDFPTFNVTREQKIGLKEFVEKLDYSVSNKKGLKDDILNQFGILGIHAKKERFQSMVEKEETLSRLVVSSSLIFNNFLIGAQFNEVPSRANALLFKDSAPHNMNMIAFAQMVTIYNHALDGIPIEATNEFLARKEINDLLAHNQVLGRIGNNIATAFTRELKEDCDFSGVVDILSDLLAGVWPDKHHKVHQITKSIIEDSSYENRKTQTGALVTIFDQIDARSFMNDSYSRVLEQYEKQLFDLYTEIESNIDKIKTKIEQISVETDEDLLENIQCSTRFSTILDWIHDIQSTDPISIQEIRISFHEKLEDAKLVDMDEFSIAEKINFYFDDVFNTPGIEGSFLFNLENQFLLFHKHYKLKESQERAFRHKQLLELTVGPKEGNKVDINHILGLYMLHRMCKTII